MATGKTMDIFGWRLSAAEYINLETLYIALKLESFRINKAKRKRHGHDLVEIVSASLRDEYNKLLHDNFNARLLSQRSTRNIQVDEVRMAYGVAPPLYATVSH